MPMRSIVFSILMKMSRDVIINQTFCLIKMKWNKDNYQVYNLQEILLAIIFTKFDFSKHNKGAVGVLTKVLGSY